MKKVPFFLVAIFLVFMALSYYSFAEPLILHYDGKIHKYTEDILSLKINGEDIAFDVPPVIINNRTLVPVRAVGRELDADITWDGINKKVNLQFINLNMDLVINNDTVVINGKEEKLDVPAKLINERTMVPLRFIGEQMNMNVGWYPDKNLVTLNSSRLRGIRQDEDSENQRISILLDNCKVYNVFRLKDPDRIVIDVPNAIVVNGQSRIEINKYPVTAVRYAQFDKSTIRIVFDVTGKPDYEVISMKDRLVVSFKNSDTSGNLKPEKDNNDQQDSEPEERADKETEEESADKSTDNQTEETNDDKEDNDKIVKPDKPSTVTYEKCGDKALLILSDIKLTDKNGEVLYRDLYDSTKKTYIIRIPDSIALIENKTLRLKDGLLNDILIFENSNTKEYFLVFNSTRKLLYNISYDSDIKSTMIEIGKHSLAERGGTEREDINNSVNKLTDITHTMEQNGQRISIKIAKYDNYNVFRLTDPDRVVIDIPEAMAPGVQEIININTDLVNGVRYAQYENNIARIVVDLAVQAFYSVSENEGELVIHILKPEFNNVVYHNVYDRVYLVLQDIVLTGGEENDDIYYKEFYDTAGNNYTINFSSELADLGKGKLLINDGMLKSIEITDELQEGKTSVIFHAKDGFIYNVNGRELINNTAVTVIRRAAKSDKLVVIDAGHGGRDPGAVRGSIYEKDFNLDIALRLERLLKKNGINTYMMRQNDSFINLYERAYIANELNAALFLSIHNNSIKYPDWNGSETFYFPVGTTDGSRNGKWFAGIVQRKLIHMLDTKNRGVKPEEFIVLKATTMPAALAEIAFMSNKDDLRRLMSDDFRQKTAEALCNAVIEALK